MYRTIEDKTWVDPWHQGLSPFAKCVFHYLVETAANNAGVAELSLAQLEFHTGVEKHGGSLPEAIRELAGKVMWWPDLNYYFVVNLHRYQGSKSNLINFQKSARNQLKGVPDPVLAAVAEHYPELVHDAPLATSTSSPSQKAEPPGNRPGDLVSGLVDKLRSSSPAWQGLKYSTVQKAMGTHGREIVVYALQHLIESGVEPLSGPHPLFVATCQRLKESA